MADEWEDEWEEENLDSGNGEGGFEAEDAASWTGTDDGFHPRGLKRSRDEFDAEQLPSNPFPPLPPTSVNSGSLNDCLLNNQWEALLNTAQTMSLPKRQCSLPWERGFASLVFGTSTDSAAPIRLPPIAPIIASTSSSSSALQQADKVVQKAVDMPGAWPVIARRLKGLNWDDARELKRSKALQRLKDFFHQNPEGTGLGRLLMKDIMSMESESNLTTVIADIFSRKATKTLAKRSWALTRYALFCRLRNESPVPVLETTLYAYLVKECSTSARRGRQICEALNFTISTRR